MFIQYKFQEYAAQTVLGIANQAAAVLADLVGLLTGTITTVDGLSAYCDKAGTGIVGIGAPWTVYDTAPHAGYPTGGRVLRRLNSDGVTYSYLLILVATATNSLNVIFGAMGHWDTTTKTSRNVIVDSYHANSAFTPPNTVLTTTNMPLTDTQNYQTYRVITPASNNYGATTLSILNTATLLAMWLNAGGYSQATNAPGIIIAEHDNQHPYSNSAAGCAPIIYGPLLYQGSAHAPHIKTPFGQIIEPTFVQPCSVFSNPRDSGSVMGYLSDPAQYIPDYSRDSAGNVAIPVVPIDVQLKYTGQPYACYAGRLKSLFATLGAAGNPGDTFTLGSDTWVLIPMQGYSSVPASYSTIGKFCARVA